jgi:hypothetical protein
MKKTQLYRSPYFTIFRIENKKKLELEMVMNTPIVNTKHLTHTMDFITNHCPNVLKTDCFNDSHLPFRIEVQETEIAHLLEHIILDEWCAQEVSKGAETATYSGNTSWNWLNEPRGTFHISFDLPKEESIFIEALSKASLFIDRLFEANTTQRAASSLPAE